MLILLSFCTDFVQIRQIRLLPPILISFVILIHPAVELYGHVVKEIRSASALPALHVNVGIVALVILNIEAKYLTELGEQTLYAQLAIIHALQVVKLIYLQF